MHIRQMGLPARGAVIGGALLVAVLACGPTPDAADADPVPPSLVVAVEHYNRICRVLDRGIGV